MPDVPRRLLVRLRRTCGIESTVADEEQRLGTIEYAKHESQFQCPACDAPMHAFNYRAYNVELDACAEGHGWWLDAGESERVRDEVVLERVAGLRRSAGAQKAWARAKGRGSSGVSTKSRHCSGGAESPLSVLPIEITGERLLAISPTDSSTLAITYDEPSTEGRP